MKHLSRILIALVLALVIAGTLPAQVFADALPEYVSEVKIYQGSCDAAASEGFKILSDEKGDPIDLNQGSGSTDIGAKGNKKVYLGYKTTTNKKDAITDLALMNMKGGYSVSEYDALMEYQLKEQILPLIDRFIVAIKEYRENYYSKNEANQKRAQYVHDALNKLYDDDTSQLLGDLLLHETLYERAARLYDALSSAEQAKTTIFDVSRKLYENFSEQERVEHADLVTIILQANGQATLLLENLITRAADTEDDTWLERLEGVTYEDLLAVQSGSPTDKMNALAKQYDDDAQEILAMWDTFKDQLDKYDETLALLKAEEAKDLSKEEAIVAGYDPEKATDEQTEAYANATAAIRLHSEIIANYNADIFCHDLLENIDYGDGTLLEFFTMERKEISDDITLLYPLVACLTGGQRAGLEFITLQELVMIGASDAEGYKNAKIDDMITASVYLGVDREIYQKGGVALTSEALRKDAPAAQTPEKSYACFIWGCITAGLALTGIGVAAASFAVRNTTLKAITAYNDKITNLTQAIKDCQTNTKGLVYHMADTVELNVERGGEMQQEVQNVVKKYGTYLDEKALPSIDNAIDKLDDAYNPEYLARMTERSETCKYMMTGAAVFTVVMIITSAVLIGLSYAQMKAYYNVDFTPIPHYMVDAKDITAYNEDGDLIVLKNQSAYYKAVESNRKKGDAYFSDIGACADLNGCVNPQWLALYAVKNEAMSPILASSLKVVVGNVTVPQGYETGIHMFGEKAAFNLNSKDYCWNQSAKSVMVYFKVEKAAPSSAGTTGSNFTAGNLALAGGAGLAIGALISGLAVSAAGKKKKTEATA